MVRGPSQSRRPSTMPKTVILGAARTPFGKLGGALSSLDATELGGQAITAALERAEVAPEQVQHVSFGQVLQAGQGQIPSRQAQIKGGIPKEVPSETINKVCASGIRTVTTMDTSIRAGDLEVGVAGGMESMSQAPYLLKEARFGFRMGDAKAIDAMINDGLTNPFSGKHMAQEASEVAAELEMTKPDMDRFALRSHELSIKATDEGAKREGRDVLATILAHAQVADDFAYIGRTPANAAKAALAKAGLDVDAIDLFEINEAFASVALNSMRMLGVDENKVNVNGGAIALGHPIGASGARILGTLVHELRRRGGGLGVAAICSGGGQGDAVIVEGNGN